MSKPVSIAVIGSINLDIVATAARLPVAGETVTGATLAYHPGGKGANQALAAAKLGAAVSMFGCVGDDAGAQQALRLLREHGVDMEGIHLLAGQATGVALIAVAENGENQIVVAPGANLGMEPHYLATWANGQFDATICQLEIPIATIEAIADKVQGYFAINLAPAQDVPDSILQRADLIIVNETEAAFYGAALDNAAGLVVVTLGGAGAKIYQGGQSCVTATPPDVVPVDTTGAGDTFVGALVLALMEGQDQSQALRFACAAGAAATLKPGAQPSMPSRRDVLALMEAPA
jgi:ribokinase